MAAARWTAAENNFLKYNVVPGEIGTSGAHSVGAGFFGGDGLGSCDLGGGRTMWMAGDTFYATAGGQARASCAFVRNSVGISTGYDLSTCSTAWYVRDSGGVKVPFFAETVADGVGFEKGSSGAVRLDNVLIACGALVRATSVFPFFDLYGSWADLFWNIDDTPNNWLWTPLDLPFPKGPGAPYTTAAPRDPGDGFVYFFVGSSIVRFDRNKAKSGDLSNPEWVTASGVAADRPDRYGMNSYVRENRWTDHETFFLGRTAGDSYSQRGGGAWQLRGAGLFVPEVWYALASSVKGPYAGLNVDYTVSDAGSVLAGGKYVYAASTTQQLTFSGKTGNDHVVVYSTNGSNSGTSVFADARYYWPEILKVTSPSP